MAFITVYAKSTGQKHRIPETWLADLVIGRQFTKTARQKKADDRAAARQSASVASNPEAAPVADDQTPPAGDQKE